MHRLRIVKFGIIHFVLLISFAPLLRAQSAEIDLSKQIMQQLACYCGCRLPANSCEGNMTCSESRKLHAEVTQLLSSGKNEEAVLDALVDKYGETILAAPTTKGFNLTAWTFPFLALLVGAFIVFRVIHKLSKKSSQTPETNLTVQTKKGIGSDSYLEKKFEQELREFGE